MAAKSRNGIARGGVTISTIEAFRNESLIDFISRKTRMHGQMCPCDFCKFARAM